VGLFVVQKLGKDNRIIVEQKILCMDIPKHREILYKNRDCCYDFHHYATAPLFCLSYKKISTSIAGGFSYTPIRLYFQQRPNRRTYFLTFALYFFTCYP
ncbi:hypothetical protein, partial [Peptoanaerobacter stomatis]|uniref:hypothetical protein n=1 Tax=Peptoanaerobacter stomatis TaxID=796937 RepID=UPI001A9987BC